MINLKAIKVIAFDADDTLWENEPYFRESEKRFGSLLEAYLPSHTVERMLFKTEVYNLSTLGYGTKSFIISMIETAIAISDGKIEGSDISKIIQIGKEQLEKPVLILDGVEKTLNVLKPHYRLVMATKGDLVEQEKKLKKSGLMSYFHHTEIVSEKQEEEYLRIIGHLDIHPEEFLMVGNSLKSDILPVLNVGGNAIHIPFHTTWEYEQVEAKVDHPKFKQVDRLTDLITLFNLPE